MARRPNILLLYPDQWRGQALRAAGDPNARTPAIDRLVDEGVFCSNAISTTPVCTPSRASLMTGLFATATRTYTNGLALPVELPTLARTLTATGYRCGWIGKWHLDRAPWDRFTPPGPRRAGWDAYWAAFNCAHDYFRPKWFEDTDELHTAEGYEPVIQTDLAEAFIRREGASGGPWCLGVSWGPPHEPYEQAPDEFRERRRPGDLTLRPNVRDLDVAWHTGPDLAPDLQAISDYYANCDALDHCIARLTAVLSETAQDQDTIVVFTSDHGDQLWSHGRRGKLVPYDESISVPLVVRWPAQIPAGSRCDSVIGTPDLPTTLLGLAGAPPIPGAQGRDLSGALRGAGGESDDVLIGRVVAGISWDPGSRRMAWRHSQREWRGVRTRRHTYARYRDEPLLLFDNQADPFQRTNLVGQPEYIGLAATLERRLESWLVRLGDPFRDSSAQLLIDGVMPEFVAENETWGLPRREPESLYL